ncbi:MAG: hypothetical protein B6D57_01420 [Candidatus Coatesbacteria bacterium 4484_99]|uniref:Iron-sulfur cluster carrier protein n=1 Tax=Candidatus Coatesbacteria bacterium 4484_99 TaxID=1970774 RepID=A0A1W9S2F4_9BACT|nr:MAG: hypothetical protein B6D57_01420 [Candidatus Coatesbacteria bacterium 4484_99]RLC43685.1 MAG: ATP-binding protein [Candidatus Coatesbacteria bacterium]
MTEKGSFGNNKFEVKRFKGEDDRSYEQRKRIVDKFAGVKLRLLVLSGKGGVGKSFVATNLAFTLSQMDYRVGLVDVDIHGPSIPKLMGLEGVKIEIRDNQIMPVRYTDGLEVISIGFFMKGDDSVIWRGPMKAGAIRQFLGDVAWGDIDMLVVDSPPGTGDEPLSVAQLLLGARGSIVVTTPQDLSVGNVGRSVTFSRTVGMPVIGAVENMSYMTCPHCGERIELFPGRGADTLYKEMGVPVIGRLPFKPEVVALADEGKLAVRDDDEFKNAFDGIAEKVIEYQRKIEGVRKKRE